MLSDILGIVSSIGDLSEITTRATNKQVDKNCWTIFQISLSADDVQNIAILANKDSLF